MENYASEAGGSERRSSIFDPDPCGFDCLLNPQLLFLFREQLVLLTGGRDKKGSPLLTCPSKKDAEKFTQDDLCRLVSYLIGLPGEESTKYGFTVLVDMRKSTWNSVKPLLKAMSETKLGDRKINCAFLIKPDNFLQKQKANFGTSKLSFETTTVSVANLHKHVDPNQLTPEFEGGFFYDHEAWIQIRLMIENFTHRGKDMMMKLQSIENQMINIEPPPSTVGLEAVQAASSTHSKLHAIIGSAPFDELIRMGHSLKLGISGGYGQQQMPMQLPGVSPHAAAIMFTSPDMYSSLPLINSTLERIEYYRPHLYRVWEDTNIRLHQCYQLRVFQGDVVIVFDWLNHSKDIFLYQHSQIGHDSQSALQLQKSHESFTRVASEAFQEMERLLELANTLVEQKIYASAEVECEAAKLRKQRGAFVDAVQERTRMLSAAVNYFIKSEQYVECVPQWNELIVNINIQPSSPDKQQIRTGLNNVFNNITNFYHEVCECGKTLLDMLQQPPQHEDCLTKHTDYSGAVEQVMRVSHLVLGHFQQLESSWKVKNEQIDLALQVEVFEQDAMAVVNWISDHGEPFVTKNNRIGQSQSKTKQQIKQHGQFIERAEVTFKNANRLLQSGTMLLQRGVDDQAKIQKLTQLLQLRMLDFKEKINYRTNLLNLSDNFYGNMKQINRWITVLQDKLSKNFVPPSLEEVEEEKRVFENERNATIDAMLQCRGEGEQLLEELRQMSVERSGRYDKAAYNTIMDMVTRLDERKRDLDDLWNSRKHTLDMASKMRSFERRCREISETACYWIQKLEQIRDQNSAYVVRPMAAGEVVKNFEEAVKVTVTEAAEVLMMGRELKNYVDNSANFVDILGDSPSASAEESTDQEASEAARVKALNKIETIWNELNSNVEALQGLANIQKNQMMHELQVWSFHTECQEALLWIRTAEDQLDSNPIRITDVNDAADLETEALHFHAALQRQHHSILGVYQKAEMLVGSDIGLSEINDSAQCIAQNWGRLVSRVEYRNDLAKSATNFFRIHNQVVDVLESLERQFTLEEDVSWDSSAAALQQLIRRHGENKGEFTSLCGTHRKKSEGFIKQLDRKTNFEPDSKSSKDNSQLMYECVQQKLDSAIRLETTLLTAWAQRKQLLEERMTFSDLKATAESELQWLANQRNDYVTVMHNILGNRGGGGARPDPDNVRHMLNDHESYRLEVRVHKQTIEELVLRYCSLALSPSQSPVEQPKPNAAPSQFSSAALQGKPHLNQLHKLCNKVHVGYSDFASDLDVIRTKLYALIGVPPGQEQFTTDLRLECKSPDVLVASSQSPAAAAAASPAAIATSIPSQNLTVQSSPIDTEGRRLERKREYIMQELLETEKVYVRDINICIKNFMAEFDVSSALPACLQDMKQSVFSNIKHIYEFHAETFVKELEFYRGRPEDVGHGFVRHARTFRQLYVEYCRNMPESNRLIQLPDSITFFENIKERCNLHLEIQSCLIKPVQRITKYSLLLKDLLGCCDCQSEINEALELMKTVPQRANDTMHLSLLQGVPKELNLEGQGDLILQDTFHMWDSRQLIKKGRDRHLFLFEDFIVFAKITKDSNGQKKYQYKFKFDIRNGDYNLKEHLDGDEKKFGLQCIYPFNDGSKYVFKASSLEVKTDWIRALRELSNVEKNLYLAKKLLPSASSTFKRDKNPGASSLSVSGSANDTTSLDSSNTSQQFNRDSKISRDSQASTGDELENDSCEKVSICSFSSAPSDKEDSAQQSGSGAGSGRAVKEEDDESYDSVSAILSSYTGGDVIREASTLHVSDDSGVGGSSAAAGGVSVDLSNSKRSNSIKKWLTSPVRKLSGQSRDDPSQSIPVSLGSGLASGRRPTGIPIRGSAYRTVSSAAAAGTTPTAVAPPQKGRKEGTEGQNERLDLPLTSSLAGSIEEAAEETTTTLDRQPQLPPPMPDLCAPSGLSYMESNGTASGGTTPTCATTPVATPSSAPPGSASSAGQLDKSFASLSIDPLSPITGFPPRQPTTKRECMIFEIADTEAKYVQALATIVEGYMSGVQSIRPAPPHELQERLPIVWGNIRQIYEWHRNTLLNQLSQVCYSGSESDVLDLANLFIRHDRKFQMYRTYSLNVNKADHIIGEHDSYFQELRRNLGLKMNLKDLIIEPVQRVMRYQLMLQGFIAQLEKHADTENPAHITRLKHALKVMTKLPKEVNDMMQLGKLIDYDESNGKITAQGKLLLQTPTRLQTVASSPSSHKKSQSSGGSGSHHLSSSTGASSKEWHRLQKSGSGDGVGADLDQCQVFLFEQCILVAETEKYGSAQDTRKQNAIGPRFTFKFFIKGSKMNELHHDKQSNPLLVRLECSEKSYDFLFESPETASLWADTLRDLISQRKDFAKALSQPINYQNSINNNFSP